MQLEHISLSEFNTQTDAFEDKSSRSRIEDKSSQIIV